ncbi:hypothetical protein JCM10550A_11180 [Methanogenium cariaci]
MPEHILHGIALVPDIVSEFNSKKGPNHISIYCTVYDIGLPMPPYFSGTKEELFLVPTQHWYTKSMGDFYP